MPAAAVIPAPIAYTKFVAVKKLVVGSQVQAGGPARAGHCPCRPLPRSAVCLGRLRLLRGEQGTLGALPLAGARSWACRCLDHGSTEVRDFRPGHQGEVRGLLPYPCRLRSRRCSSLSVPGGRLLYFEKIRVFKAGVADGLHNVAWNNGIGPRFYFAGLSEPEVMINRDKRGHSYCGVRGEILGSPQDELLRKHLSRMFSLIKNESQRREDDQIPS